LNIPACHMRKAGLSAHRLTSHQTPEPYEVCEATAAFLALLRKTAENASAWKTCCAAPSARRRNFLSQRLFRHA
jgi:hypothetical protein